MTFDQFKEHILGAPMPYWSRRGQFAFNELCALRPDLSEQIRGSLLDPFYKDATLVQCLDWLKEHWEAAATEEEQK